MPNDQKVGFALGLLLLGIVAAFFFRNPQMKSPSVPELESSKEVDARISEKSVTPYLTGIDTAKDEAAGSSPSGENNASYGGDFPTRREAPHWDVPDSLKKNTAESSENRYSNPQTVTPDPIPFVSATRDTKLTSTKNSKTLKYIPDHNQAWETVPPIPIPDVAGEASLNDANSAIGLRKEGDRTDDVPVHTVKSGETLSSIAADYLGSSARFEDIYEANSDLLKNPNDLRVGMKLKIPDRKRGTTLRDRDGIAVPTEGPSASNTNSAETTKPAGATSRKGLTRAAVRTPEGNPLKSDDTDAQSTADEPNADSPRDASPAGPVAPKGRFAPMRRSPYRPRTSLDQSSLDLDNLLDSGAGTKSTRRKLMTQIPPDDLPLDVEIEDDSATAQQVGEFAVPSRKVK